MKEIRINEMWLLNRIAEIGDDFGMHTETMYFCDEVGFILGVWDLRIGCEYYEVTKEEFMNFMERYHDEMSGKFEEEEN